MGHYSDVYLGYNTEVADKVEKLFRKTLGKEPAELFDDEFIGQYHNYDSYNPTRVSPTWVILSTKNTKWYDSYEPEGEINKIVESMQSSPDIYTPEDWFWIRIGEQFPELLSDLVLYGQVGESPFEWDIKLMEYEGSGSSGIRWKSREEFDSQMDPIPPYTFGTINFAYIEKWVDYFNKEHRIIPDDEIWD